MAADDKLDRDIEEVLDDAMEEEQVPPVRYSITSYGVDFDVEGIVRRMRNRDIAIPTFQRSYVWNIAEASRFIESLLLGLPVPGIFLSADHESKQLLVIDGQQRLKSLEYFYLERFVKGGDADSERVFRLAKVQPDYEGLTYSELEQDARRTLDNSVIHATVIRQESPAGDDTSLFHIFERLNTGGRRLVPQEIRTAIYQGDLIDLLSALNRFEPWRLIFGKPSHRLKDEELILRFFALLEDRGSYAAPMTEFLSKFAKRRRFLEAAEEESMELIFKQTILLIYEEIGARAFRIGKTLNAAVFDSVMIAVADGMRKPGWSGRELLHRYNDLLTDTEYQAAVSKATANEKTVAKRLEIAEKYLGRA